MVVTDPFAANVVATETTLNEIAEAINELRRAGAYGQVKPPGIRGRGE